MENIFISNASEFLWEFITFGLSEPAIDDGRTQTLRQEGETKFYYPDYN